MSRNDAEQTKDREQPQDVSRVATVPVTDQRHHHPKEGEPTEGLKTLYG